MKQKIELMKKVLTGLLEEVEEISEQIKTKGIVPREICELCRVRGKRTAVKFTPEKKPPDEFEEWLKKMDIIAIEKRELDNRTFIKTSKKMEKIRADAKDEEGYVYGLPDLHDTRSAKYKAFSKYPKMRFSILGFLSQYEKIETCPHFEKHPNNVLKIEFQARQDLPFTPKTPLVKEKMHKLLLCCDDCKEHIENTLCDRVHKRGFLFDYDCPLEDITLRKRLSQNGLIYENLAESDRNEYPFGPWRGSIYYVRQNSTLFSRWRFRVSEYLQDIVKYLKPELIVAFDDHTNLPSYLECDTNILFYNENGMFIYDKDRQPETNIQLICEKIASVLNTYIETKRGKEHDRIVSSLYSIGQELGYVPQLEYNKSGVRIDCVWFDREGNIQVALEVETSSTWKKDIISTWEVEPRLAVIVGHAKSDKVATNLMDLSLMKSIPHPVLYINKHTERAFLFDKQEIIKHYALKQEEEDKRKDIKII